VAHPLDKETKDVLLQARQAEALKVLSLSVSVSLFFLTLLYLYVRIHTSIYFFVYECVCVCVCVCVFVILCVRARMIQAPHLLHSGISLPPKKSLTPTLNKSARSPRRKLPRRWGKKKIVCRIDTSGGRTCARACAQSRQHAHKCVCVCM
jgi:hypothetical protein